MIDPATIAFYEAHAGRCTEGGSETVHRHLDPFLDRLPPKALVLELGCGAGRDAAQMIARGFRVDATDATPAMVALANMRLGVRARLLTFAQLDACDTYDAVWAHACLIHVPRAEFTTVVARVCRSLKRGGWHFANFKLGLAEGRDLLGRLHNFPTRESIETAYRAAGFEVLEGETYRGMAADGVSRNWYAVTVRKP